MKQRILPCSSSVQLYDIGDTKHLHSKTFTLEECIGEGASCVAYKATGEQRIPFKLKQFIPRGMEKDSDLYRLAEKRCMEAFKQQISLLSTEGAANITSGISALYRDQEDCLWSCTGDLYGLTYDKRICVDSFFTNLAILRKIAEGVKAYHEAGWLLLDLKPENILVIDSLGISGVNFFDFDSFIRKEDIETAAAEGRIIVTSATESYSAPELLSSFVNLARISERSDFYSLGAMLFTALFGRKPKTIDCMPGKHYRFPEGLLSAGAEKSTAAFLRQTLSASTEERFSGDDELIEALDEIIKLTDSSVPHISSLLPKPIAGFVGRNEEEKEIITRLDAGRTPLFISAEGGMGKTQLILKTASDYNDRYHFVFTSYQGNLRDTILSIPFDHLDTESEEVRFKVITDYLKNSCFENTVLIIDNFDAADPAHSAELLEDEDYPLVSQLPIKVVFTTRNVFRGVETVALGILAEDDLAEMMHALWPAAESAVLSRIIFSLHSHTLACRTVAETAAEKKIPFPKLETALAAEKSVSENLHSIFCLAHFSREEQNLLAEATLFPQRGLSADILFALLAEKQYTAAMQLRSAGWLRFDEYSNLWSMHPLMKEVCLSMHATTPSKGKITALRKNLAEAKKNPISFSKRGQINEIYANMGDLPPSRVPLIFSSVAVIFAILAGFWAYRTVHANDGIDPLLTIQLSQSESITEEEQQHDIEIVKGRIHALTGSGKHVSEEDGGELGVQIHMSDLGNPEDTEEAIHLYINRPLKLYVEAFSDSSHLYHKLDYIDRSEILSVTAKGDRIPGVSPAEYNLDPKESYQYIQIELADRAAALIREDLAAGYETTLSFDADYDSHVALPALIPSETENVFYAVIQGNSRKLAENIVYSLSRDELSSGMSFSCVAAPAAYWEETNAYGLENLCLPEELAGDTVTVKYSYYDVGNLPESFDSITKKFYRRLNSLGVPFSAGVSTEQDCNLTCSVRTEDVSPELLVDLFASPQFTVRDGGKSFFDPSASAIFSAEIAQNPDTGGYELTVQLKEDDSDYQKLETITAQMVENGIDSIYLGTNDHPYYLRAEVNHIISDGVLVFNSMPMYDTDTIGEQELAILKFFRHILTSDGYIAGYSPARYTFSSEDSSFAITENFAVDNRIRELLDKRFPNIAFYRDGDICNIFLYLDPGENFVENTETLVTEIWNACPFNECLAYGIWFRPVTPLENGELLYVCIYPEGSSFARYGTVDYMCRGGRFDDYSEHFNEVFSSQEFYSGLNR